MVVKPVSRSFVLALILAPFLVLMVSRLARTEIILGDYVRTRVEHVARRHGADVEILTIAPAGLWGLELEQVALRLPRGDFAIEADLESIEITPSLTSLWSDRPTIDSVVIRGGTVGVRPWEAAPKETTAPAKPADAAPPPPGAPPPAPREIEVTLRNVDFVAYNALYRTRPLHIENLELIGSRAGVTSAAGFGKLPDGVAFKMADEGPGSIALHPEKRAHIDRWVAPLAGASWPIALSATELRVCARRSCETFVELTDVELAAPVWRDDVRVTAPEARIVRDHGELVLEAPEMAIVDPETRDFAARLTEIDVRHALGAGTLAGAIEIADAEGGTLTVVWDFDAEDLNVGFEARQFDASAIWHLVPAGERLRPHRVDGRLTIGHDVTRSTAELTASLRLDRLSAWFPLTRESFDFSDIGIDFTGFVDIAGRSLSVNRATVELGEAGPLVVQGNVIHAGRGWSFDIEATLQQQEASVLAANLPRQLVSVTTGAVLGGALGFAVDARGHTAYPESLIIETALESTVVVEQDAPATDPRRLGRHGPPPQHEFPRWVSMSALPRHVVDAVLAAEDARFFEHDGFDVRGLQRAMIHNLTVGRLARGGSTISQQVAKNVWLSGERTVARKLEEAYLTWRLEAVHTKRRILEIYLNVASWGPGVKGIAAAAEHYFEAPVHRLEVVEAALLAAILPNPARFGGWIERGYLASSRLEKVEHTLSNLRFMKKITADQYTRWWRLARDEGRLGRLQLRLCADDDSAPPGAQECREIAR